jgi:chorismate mutase / prephenate dehydratase
MNEPTRGEPATVQAEASRSEADVRRDDDLRALRTEIDRVDREILARLNERARLVAEVGTLKRATGGTVYQAARERDLIAGLEQANAGPFPTAAIRPVFREIISATYGLERTLRVAYLGPEGTFSHLAARETFGSQVELGPEPTIADVFTAVERGRADHGVVPVENTTEGVVTQTLDTFVGSEVPICGEVVLPIALCLLSRTGRLEDVRRVASHPQPLAQCRSWLDRHLPRAERIAVASTVAAGALAAAEADVAAVGSRLAAELLGLVVAAENVQDRRDNSTRFVVIGGEQPAASGHDLTSLVFTVRKAEAGALHRLLAPFARHGVNLTSIQSRPMKGAPWEYLFFIDVEGHRSEPAVAGALAEASGFAHSARVLGSFPRAALSGSRRREAR